MVEETRNTNESNMLTDAARMLAHHLGQCSQFADYYVAHAWDGRPPGENTDHRYLMVARDMMRLAAELAAALAKLKGEVRQHIVVERIERPQPVLVGEARAVASAAPEGGGADSAKRVVAVASADDATS